MAAAAVLGLALVVSACGDDGGGSASDSTPSKGKVTIGAFNFPESSTVAYLYAGLLEKAGYEPTVKEIGAREVVEPALEKGDIQLVPEYLGTFTEFLNAKVNGANPKALASSDVDATLKAAQGLASPRGLTVLEPAVGADQNAFAVTKDFAEANNLTKLSDLAAYSNTLVLGGPPECPQRPFCQPGLEKTYGIKFTGFERFAKFPLIKAALVSGKVQLGLVFSSDSSNATNNLVVLEDDKKLQTVDNVVPVVKSSANSEALSAALAKLNDVLTSEELIQLNKAVEVDRKTSEAAANAWLQEKGLI